MTSVNPVDSSDAPGTGRRAARGPGRLPLDAHGIGIGQLIRLGWFTANYRLAERRIKPLDRPVAMPDDMPGRDALIEPLFALLREDRANVRAGVYPQPADAIPTPAEWLRQARAFFADLPKVDARRRADNGRRDLRETPPQDGGDLGALPAYYTQNFHFQTDGYLSADSAALYDYQVDVLFSGATDAMRRLCLPPLVEAFAERRLRAPLLLDVACGTARTIRFLKQRWPAARVVGLDLSAPYLARGARSLADLGRVHLVRANGERIPLPDNSLDGVTCIFTFHELPPKVRAIFSAEMHRVLKPGGRCMLVDSLQTGDNPALDALLEYFPRFYHEPYYDSYRIADLGAVFEDAGFEVTGRHVGFLAKRFVLDKRG